MILPYFIASRYLFSKKKHNVINIISLISVVGVAVVTMALVIVLSVFNGMDEMVSGMVGPFYSDIKISPKEGKNFTLDTITRQKLESINGIKYITELVEESALVKYEDRQRPVIIKGVSDSYIKSRDIKNKLFDGEFMFSKDGFDYVVPGYEVARDLGVGISFISSLDFYFPKRGTTDVSMSQNPFNTSHAFPSGIFMLQQEIDSKYIFTSLGFAQKLLGLEGKISSLEISLEDENNVEEIKSSIQTLIGKSFVVKNRYEQNETLFKMMQSEKMAIFFILVFILLIASFNIVGSLTMLIIDKKEDINTLSYMGMEKENLQRIFWYEGWMISIVGAALGLILGLTICLSQQHFKLLTIGSREIPYPVRIDSIDILLIIGIVLLIGYIAARYPVRYLIKRLI